MTAAAAAWQASPPGAEMTGADAAVKRGIELLCSHAVGGPAGSTTGPDAAEVVSELQQWHARLRLLLKSPHMSFGAHPGTANTRFSLPATTAQPADPAGVSSLSSGRVIVWSGPLPAELDMLTSTVMPLRGEVRHFDNCPWGIIRLDGTTPPLSGCIIYTQIMGVWKWLRRTFRVHGGRGWVAQEAQDLGVKV